MKEEVKGGKIDQEKEKHSSPLIYKRQPYFVYILEGTPIPYTRSAMSKSKEFDTYKKLKFAHSNNLQEQHQSKALFCGPLKLELCFFFERPRIRKNPQEDPDNGYALLNYNAHKPDLFSLLRFVQDIAQGIVYETDASLVTIIMEKKFYKEPKTEIRITPLPRL